MFMLRVIRNTHTLQSFFLLVKANRTDENRCFQRGMAVGGKSKWDIWDGIRMNLREIGLGGVDWIRLSQDRDRWRAVVSAVTNLRVLAPRS
jgi:hypothetical protein